MIRRLASIFSLDATEESARAADDFSNQLRASTLDERAAFYLRAIHERDDFTKEEYSHARELILDAMSADIVAKSGTSLPEELTSRNRSEDEKQGRAVRSVKLEDPLECQHNYEVALSTQFDMDLNSESASPSSWSLHVLTFRAVQTPPLH